MFGIKTFFENIFTSGNSINTTIIIETLSSNFPTTTEVDGWRISYCQLPSNNIEEVFLDTNVTSVTVELKKEKTYEITACRLDINGNQFGPLVTETIDTPDK